MIDTANAITIPHMRIASSVCVKLNPNFIILIALKPNITGTAIKNVNSAIATLDIHINKPPMIVEPERDVPGTIEST